MSIVIQPLLFFSQFEYIFLYRHAFPSCGLKKIESGSGVITFHHDGLRKKINSTQTGPPLLKSVANTPRKGT